MELLEENRLTDAAVDLLSKSADLIACECPKHMILILQEIRKFSAYTKSCIIENPEDEKIHRWLLSSSLNLDSLLSSTIVQLARFEGFIDENNDLVKRNPVKE